MTENMTFDLLTVKDGTMTSEGFVKHKRHPGGFDMPVKLDTGEELDPKLSRYRQAPLRDVNGRLVYALPGGGAFVDE